MCVTPLLFLSGLAVVGMRNVRAGAQMPDI